MDDSTNGWFSYVARLRAGISNNLNIFAPSGNITNTVYKVVLQKVVFITNKLILPLSFPTGLHASWGPDIHTV